MSDLETYTQTRDERAFRAMVDAHLGMVFGTAMRRLGDRGLAEEITQNVFNSLARKAREIRSGEALPAWLHRATLLESSKAIRSEERRRKRMEKLIEITALEGEGLAAWKHAQADLDEAVDELPASDRDILFQRFYQEKSFREIAHASGKTEAASQKQASRALDKLADRMRARGFAVPATVLAAGLGAEFSKAAPSGLAATVSSTALAGAAATGTINILGIMSITKSTLAGTAIAAALIAAFTGGGYLSGRNAAETEQANAAGDPSSKSPSPDETAHVAAGGPVSATPAASRGSVREILQAAADHFANISNDPDADDKGEREIARLRPDEIEAALAELAMLDIDANVLERTRAELVEHWARSDGEAAANYALANSASDNLHRMVTAALYGWGEHAPKDAYDWYQQHVADGGAGATLRKTALRSVLKSWAAVDPPAALAVIAELPYDDQRHLAQTLDSLAKAEETRGPYLEALRDFPDGQLRISLIGAAVEDWAKIDPPAAAAFWDTLEFEEPMQALGHAFEVGENWFERDPAAGVDWMWEKLPDGMQEEFINDLVKRHWAELDPEGATAWLEKMGLE